MRTAAVLFALAALVAPTAACTTDNPVLSVGDGGGTCSIGGAICLEGRPVDCVASPGGFAVRPRACPSGAACRDEARCAAPYGASVCSTQRDCGTRVCAPLVDPGVGGVAAFCVDAAEGLAGAEPCATDFDCRSARCVGFQGQSDLGLRKLCYLACRENDDCPAPLRCRAVEIQVTGARGMLRVCAPT